MNLKKTVLLTALVMASVLAYAQGGCTTTWPYLYPDFVSGQLITKAGAQDASLMNIHLVKGHIHYVDKQGNIREARTTDLVKAEIAGSTFVINSGMLLKVVASSDQGFVAAQYLADMASLNETGGAYGVSSATLSTQKLSSVASNGVNMNHMEILLHKDEGQALSIKTNTFLIYNGKCCQATRKAVTEAVPEQFQSELKSFLKAEKIDWKNNDSLLKVVSFLSEL